MLSPKAQNIRQMFSAIAPRYDFLNHLLSLNIDRNWRRRAIRLLRGSLGRPGSLCLDLCSGTGDIALEMLRQGAPRAIASDFSHPMLRLNLEKLQRCDALERIRLIEADALNLPFASNVFDGLAIAFGLRNLESAENGLREMHRVLKPAGQIVVLEFSKPTNALLNSLFQFYFFNVLPRIGSFVSRHDQAYSYLPRSVRDFPDQVQLAGMFVACGFEKVGYLNLSGGIAAIHYGSKVRGPKSTVRESVRTPDSAR